MRRTIAAVLVVIALVALGYSPEAGAMSRDYSQCGNVPASVRLYGVRAKGTSCRNARKLAKQWLTNVYNATGGCTRFFCRARGFTCRAERPARVSYPVDCRRHDDARVLWRVVAD